MEKEVGERKNSFKYHYQGYYYHKKCGSTRKGYSSFRCVKYRTDGCQGSTYENEETHQVEIENKHNHEANSMLKSLSQLKTTILKECENTELKPKHQFNKIVSQQPIDVGSSISFNSMRTTMFRKRVKGLPKIPKYMTDFKDVLENKFEPTKNIFRGIVEAQDGSAAVLFASDTMLSLLNSKDTTKVEIDATFAVTPKAFSIYQLYTVHIQVLGTAFCALWVLMTRKTLHLYTAVWKKICLLAPNLQVNLVEVVADFEVAMHSSIRALIITAIQIIGCWFHFCQALLRRWKRLGLCKLNAPKRVLWMCMNLALAPPTYFKDGLNLIKEQTRFDWENYPKITSFLDYVEDQWLPKASIVCALKIQRTNNGVESFHKNAFEELGGNHPTLYSFLRKMSSYITSEDMQYLRMLKGYVIRRNVPKNILANDANILKYQRALNDGKIQLDKFLLEVVTREMQDEMGKIMEKNDNCLQAYVDDDEENFMREIPLRNDLNDLVTNNEKNEPKDISTESESKKRASTGVKKIEKKKESEPKRTEEEKRILRNTETISDQKNLTNVVLKPELKRKRGRPSKIQIASDEENLKKSILKPELKRKRGRPSKKHPESKKTCTRKIRI